MRASIVVPAQAPLLAVEEIERLAADQRFVQVLLPAACEMMLGRSYYWPIYEAATRHGLPIGIHAGSMYRYAPTSTGWPSHYLHDYVANSQLFEDQLLSLVSNGVFVKFPELKFVFIESGVSWLPPFIWRAIKTWRGVRAEVPWVNRSPADIIRSNIRVTTQPFDAPDQETVERIVEQIDCDEMLLFSSDYPHWQFEGDAITPARPVGCAVATHSGGQSARHLSSSEGDRVMNAPVDVAQHRADATSKYGIIDCDVHPYPKAGRAEQVSVGAVAQARRRIWPDDDGHLRRRAGPIRGSAEHVAPRFVAAEWRRARLGRRFHPRAIARSLQHHLRRAGAAYWAAIRPAIWMRRRRCPRR